ncbi:MAG: transglutaminase domain-containing protein [Chloroflexota bacterium]
MKKIPLRRWDWTSFALLVLMLQVASVRLVITDWAEFLFLSETLAALGVILGLALGCSQFKRLGVFLLALGYSIVLIPWQLSLVTPGDVALLERLASVGGRLLFSVDQFFQREVVEDTLLFVAFISTVVWFISLVSAYWWARHENYLAAALPGGIFTLTIHLYDPLISRRIMALGIYTLLALFLLGRKYYLNNCKDWRTRRVFQMQGTSFDLMRGIAITATLIVFLAWTVPASAAGWESAIRSWNRVTRPWREVQEWLSTAVESLEAPVGRGSGDFYGSQLDLGIGNPLADTILFTVRVNSLPERPPRLYWRGFVYDTYANQHWINTYTGTDEFSPDLEPLSIPDLTGRSPARFTITTQIKQALLYMASQPVWISRPGQIKAITVANEERDLAAWYADPRLSPGEQYQVQVALANPSIQDLQAAGTDYPAWVAERYLQLPEDFSPRIRALAAEVTAGQPTPYDQATAVTRYLRSELEYTNPLPAPPPENADPLEWLLFEDKHAFCNYYATAEVLMLRSLGVPARLAVGFAEGEFDAPDLYAIRNLDAHAWPEVYFPGVGWVEFEPTGNQSPLIRPDIPEPAGPDDENPLDRLQAAQALGREPDDPRLGRGVEDVEIPTASSQRAPSLLFLGLAVVLLGALFLLDRKYAVVGRFPVYLQTAYEKNGGQAPTWIARWAGWTLLTPIQRAFETVNRSLRLLGETPSPYHTPAERARALEQRLPQAASAIQSLATQHQAALFTPQAGHTGKARRASFMIWLYTLRMLLQRLWKRLDDRFGNTGQFS